MHYLVVCSSPMSGRTTYKVSLEDYNNAKRKLDHSNWRNLTDFEFRRVVLQTLFPLPIKVLDWEMVDG